MWLLPLFTSIHASASLPTDMYCCTTLCPPATGDPPSCPGGTAPLDYFDCVNDCMKQAPTPTQRAAAFTPSPPVRRPEPSTSASRLAALLRNWDKGSKTIRTQILVDFVAQCRSMTGPQLEKALGNGASLLLARICLIGVEGSESSAQVYSKTLQNYSKTLQKRSAIDQKTSGNNPKMTPLIFCQ